MVKYIIAVCGYPPDHIETISNLPRHSWEEAEKLSVEEKDREIERLKDALRKVDHPHTVKHDEQQAEQSDLCELCGVARYKHRERSGRP